LISALVTGLRLRRELGFDGMNFWVSGKEVEGTGPFGSDIAKAGPFQKIERAVFLEVSKSPLNHNFYPRPNKKLRSFFDIPVDSLENVTEGIL
jgi:hypothetical protein